MPTAYALNKVLRLRDMSSDQLVATLNNYTQMMFEPEEALATFDYVMSIDSETITRTITLMMQSQIDNAALLRATVDVLGADKDSLAGQEAALAEVLADVDQIQILTYSAALVAAGLSADPAENIPEMDSLLNIDRLLDTVRELSDVPHELVMLHVAIKAAIALAARDEATLD